MASDEILGARDFVLAASATRRSKGSRDFTATSRRTCATVPQPSELRFEVVSAVGRGIAVLDGGQRSLTGRGGFRGFCSSPTVKCFRFVCENLTTFTFGKRFVGFLAIY